MLNSGTLVGAPIRPIDSSDQYPVALQEEIKGGAHSVNAVADMDNIGSWLREAGMTCYVIATGNTYQLQNDLVTWNLFQSAGGGDPGSGGDSADISLLSGNFGAWTALNSPSANTIDQISLQFKTDLSAFPSRVITYLQGQFSLNADFTGTSITLGNLPVTNRPSANINKYMIVLNVEMYLQINTDGDVILSSKDGFNLPTGNVTAPYYIDTFFQPVVATVYTATRTENFTRNNCGAGSTGSVVSYTQNYTSTVDQATANALAAGDSEFETNGQTYANANGTCTVNPPAPTYNLTIENESSVGTIIGVSIEGAENYSYSGILHGQTVQENIGNYLYRNVAIALASTSYPATILCNGVGQTLTESHGDFSFPNVQAPITIIFGD